MKELTHWREDREKKHQLRAGMLISDKKWSLLKGLCDKTCADFINMLQLKETQQKLYKFNRKK